MAFNDKFYQLRKKSGLSQEKLANQLNVSRQTISKWEVGDSTPESEKLVAISDLFNISLDELTKDKCPEPEETTSPRGESSLEYFERRFLTEENKRKVKRILKICLIILLVFPAIDFVCALVFLILRFCFGFNL